MIKDLEVLVVKPDDLLVLRVPRGTTEDEMERMGADLATTKFQGRVLIVSPEVQIAVTKA